MFWRRFITLACLCCSLWGGSLIAQAQESLGLVPAFIDATVKRGTTYTQEFTIANNTRTRLRFRCSLGDYWYDDKNQRLMGRPGTLPHSASSWAQFAPDEVIIDANTSAKVKMIITVPSDAAGGYYTMPFFEGEPADKPEQPKGRATSSVAVRLGGLLMLATEGNSEYNVEVMGGQVVPPTEASELEMSLDIRNRGTAHARLRGMFAILNSTGKLAGRGKIEEKRYLPGQRDVLKAPWAGELAPGRYTAVITLTYERAGLEPASLVYELPFDVK